MFISCNVSGGPGQLPHLAPTYGAVLALCTIGTKEAYDVINRPTLQRFLLKQHQEDGSYIMHADGERDIRYYKEILMPYLWGSEENKLKTATSS